MATYSRTGVLATKIIKLNVLVTDDVGNLVSTDAVPQVYIYDSTIDSETIDAEVAAETYASALAGPLAATALSTGYYQLEYTVPSGAEEGTWVDVWVSTIDSEPVVQQLSFKVIIGANIDTQKINQNEMIIVTLDSTIANSDGDLTLGTDQIISFSTTYNPFYTSPDIVRIEVGPWINYIPDDTLAFMIHCASNEAKLIASPVVCNTQLLTFAKQKLTTYDTALKALMLPAGRTLATGTNPVASTSSRKSLGDFSISNINNGMKTNTTNTDGIDRDTLGYLHDQREEWWRVVNSGGCINPGQGLDPTIAEKGMMDPERYHPGRLWENGNSVYYDVPGVNDKVLRTGRRRSRFTWSSRGRKFGRRFYDD